MLNIVNGLRPRKSGKRASQILLVPVVLWYVGVQMYGSGIGGGDAGIEVLGVFLIHVLVVIMSLVVDRVLQKQEQSK